MEHVQYKDTIDEEKNDEHDEKENMSWYMSTLMYHAV